MKAIAVGSMRPKAAGTPDVRDATAPTPCGPAVSRLLRRSGGSAAPEIAAHHRRPSTTSRTFAGPGALCGNGAARPA